METLTRLVADSLARHGLDRPVDPRRLQWSRWVRCDSPRSLLVVPSRPGIFALAEEVMNLGSDMPTTRMGTAVAGNPHVGTAAPGCPAEQSSATVAGAAATGLSRRMLAVLQFSDDDDMAFTLDRMFTRVNPMRDRLATGRCFLRFVVIEDQSQRRTICAALNQWLQASAEKASGIGADFSSSLEIKMDHFVSQSGTHVPAETAVNRAYPPVPISVSAPHLDSGAAKNLNCPQPFPSGF